MTLTKEIFGELFPKCPNPDIWVKEINALSESGFNSPERLAGFLAQSGHETGGYRVFSENLNYSAASLNIVFPKYFVRAGRDAYLYHRNPEKIANVVYANRMGNGAEQTGDGWRYRGRGLFQITGKANYADFQKDTGTTLKTPDEVAEVPKIACRSAAWFWNKNNLNKFADARDIRGMTKAINGGYNGLEERFDLYKKALDLLTNKSNTVFVDTTREDTEPQNDFSLQKALQIGSRGEAVSMLQSILGLHSDGVFGPGTTAALKKWQSRNGLAPDGVAGPITLEKMFG